MLNFYSHVAKRSKAPDCKPGREISRVSDSPHVIHFLRTMDVNQALQREGMPKWTNWQSRLTQNQESPGSRPGLGTIYQIGLVGEFGRTHLTKSDLNRTHVQIVAKSTIFVSLAQLD